jgi:hypothetical protein
MTEREPPEYFDERFTTMREAQEGLARLGYYLYPVEKEHTEGLITEPLVQRIRTRIKTRGFAHVAGRVVITFSGYARDAREIFAIPEVRASWQKLDTQLPELPAVVAFAPELGFNGPGTHLMLTGTIDQIVNHPELGAYDLQVPDAESIIAAALVRIQQAGRKYKLRPPLIQHLVEHFIRGATYHLPRTNLPGE